MQHPSSENNHSQEDEKAKESHTTQIHQPQKSKSQLKDILYDEIGKTQHANDLEEEKKSEQQSHSSKAHEGFISDEQIPDHFYDSDLASINEKDFLSDNQPPKDIIQQRKLLYKQKLLHVFKTIIRLGTQIDKPARYDRIKLIWKQVEQGQVKPRPLNIKKKKNKKEQSRESTQKVEEIEHISQNGKQDQKQGEQYQKQAESYTYPHYFSTFYLMNSDLVEYNLGREYLEIERLVTSMKRNQAAVFELEHLQVSKKSNIKRRIKVQVFVIWVEDWTTVIDVDCDGKFMKEIIQKGEGHSRIAKHDQVAFEFTLKKGSQTVISEKHLQWAKIEDDFLAKQPNILWKMMHSMKSKEKVRVEVEDQVFRQVQEEKYQKWAALLQGKQAQHIKSEETNGDKKQAIKSLKWELWIEVFSFHSIDDVFLDGRLLKKTLIRGVSTAKPDSASLVYYALRFYTPSGELLFEDPCFNSDWWEDFQKLQLLSCRKNYLDDESVSQMLKQVIKRMKPAEIADIQCRDRDLFAYGSDYEEYRTLNKGETIPETVKIGIRVYNFTEGKNCFNMQIEQKVHESRRKKAIAVRYLQRGEVARALKAFESIVAYFSSGKINQQAYEQKISALMNCTLCYLKLQNYLEMVKLCDQILQLPRHGYDPNKLKIKGPGQAKIEGKLPDQPGSDDEREEAKLQQNPKIIDKCCYRKALGLVRMGEGQKALDYLQRITIKTQEVLALEKEAIKSKEKYEKKSAKMYKNMFG